MTLRVRLALAAVVAAAIAVIGVSVVGVAFTRHRLRDQVDASLLSQAQGIAASQLLGGAPVGRGPGGRGGHPGGKGGNPTADNPAPGANAGGGDADDRLGVGTGAFQVIDATGAAVRNGAADVRDVTVEPVDIAVARRARPALLRDQIVDGVHLRIATVPAANHQAVIASRRMDDVDGTVQNLALGFGVIGIGAIGIAGLLGALVARSALAPVARLGQAAERVAASQDPSLPVPETGGRELARLGHSMNVMLRSLEDAREHERRLIDDAAHELRTPLTSLRTNVEVLASGRALDDVDRSELMADVTSQVEEFASLVGDLDALARNQHAAGEPEDVELADVVNAATRRAQRRSGRVRIETFVTPGPSGTVRAQPAMLERAVLNVLDNAVKWSPTDGVVTVAVDGTTVTVTDRGPGIAPTDLDHVFDRFWRAESARAMPGSGLGLAIVRQVIETHGGTVAIRSRTAAAAAVSTDSGGATAEGRATGTNVSLSLPAAP